MKREADIRTAAQLYKATKEDYAYDGSIFTEDSPRVARTKWIIENRLDDAEKIIIRLYCELQSMAKVAKLLGIGRSTAAKEVKRIKTKILNEYNNGNDMPDCDSGIRS